MGSIKLRDRTRRDRMGSAVGGRLRRGGDAGTLTRTRLRKNVSRTKTNATKCSKPPPSEARSERHGSDDADLASDDPDRI